MSDQLRAIDYDRGVLINQHPSGIEVYMYIDEPGVYLSAHGNVIATKFAKEAGYNVDELERKKKIKDGLREYEAKLRAEMELPEEQRKVLKEWEGFKVIELTPGRCQLLAPDGKVLHDGVLPADKAIELLDALVPEVSKT